MHNDLTVNDLIRHLEDFGESLEVVLKIKDIELPIGGCEFNTQSGKVEIFPEEPSK